MDKELLTKAKENNLEQFQIQQITIESLDIETLNDKVAKFETSNVTTYQISAIYQEKLVKINTEHLDDKIIPKLKEQALYLDIKHPAIRKNKTSIKETTTYQINQPDKVTQQLLSLNQLKKEYKELKEINCFYNESIIIRKIISEENELHDEKYQKTFDLSVLVTNEKNNSSSYNCKKVIDNSEIDLKQITKETIKNALDKLNYQEIKANTYPVILTGKVMANILNKFIPIFSKENLKRGTSILTGKEYTKVFSDKITIIEDPNNKNLLGKRLFDDAGTVTKYKEIIKDGIFSGPLYNEKTASIDNTEPTGNDYGEISVRNMYIKPGIKTQEELIQSQKEAILIDEVTGLHAGINPVTGDISVQSEGYYIKDGKIQYASKLFILSTNIMELLNQVIEISNNLEQTLNTIASPDILFNNIKIVK